MSILESDVKRLWGLAAGRCSFQGCGIPCINFIESEQVIVGQMAHIIAKRPRGPRGNTRVGENNKYENLILLCPTHHTQIDKAAVGTYPCSILQEWKKNHEEFVRKALATPPFSTRMEMAKFIQGLLVENRISWEKYGPESMEARTNPLSNLIAIWALRKVETIVPNNARIVNAIECNKSYFSLEEYEIACSFIEHAKGFERRCYHSIEGVPCFPKQFEQLVAYYVNF